MPNWGDDEGRFWWNPDGQPWYNRIEIPHPPVVVREDCDCEFCEYERKKDECKKEPAEDHRRRYIALY